MKKKSHEMKSLKEFAKQRELRNRRMKTRCNRLGAGRKGYSISRIKGDYLVTYQISIYLRNTENLEEAERNAQLAIKAIREKLGNIV